MNRTDLIIVGAGPAGMSAAIEAAKRGAHVTVFDENSRPGGQLFKQIHKFFGSKEHHTKVRGFVIGEELMAEAAKLGVDVRLDSTVIGLYQDKEVVIREGEKVVHHKANAIVIATGAAENMGIGACGPCGGGRPARRARPVWGSRRTGHYRRTRRQRRWNPPVRCRAH